MAITAVRGYRFSNSHKIWITILPNLQFLFDLLYLNTPSGIVWSLKRFSNQNQFYSCASLFFRVLTSLIELMMWKKKLQYFFFLNHFYFSLKYVQHRWHFLPKAILDFNLDGVYHKSNENKKFYKHFTWLIACITTVAGACNKSKVTRYYINHAEYRNALQ